MKILRLEKFVLLACAMTLASSAHFASAQTSGDFNPAVVSSLPEVSAPALTDEESEFSYAEARESSIEQLGVAQAKSDSLLKEYQRKQQLAKSASVSDDSLAQSMYDYQSNENEITRLKAVTEFNRLMAEAYKVRLAADEKLSPADLRKEVQFRIDAQKAKIAGLQASLATYQLALKLTSIHEDHGRSLIKSGSVSTEDMDLRSAATQTSSQHVQSTQRAITLTQTLLKSLENSIQRIL